MKKYIVYNLLLIGLSFFSCKKNQLGDKATIKGTVKHHAKAIANATVYIKFNAKEFPGTDVNVYDSKVIADSEGNYSFKCYKGEYYLYGVGIDLDEPPPSIVIGGVPAKNIRNYETKTIDVPVFE